MQELDAVNYLLNLMGSPPVGDIESLHPDVQSCVNHLRDADRTIQIRGWWFNRDYSVLLEPDETTKELTLPTDTLEMTATSQLGAVQRGTKVYDTCNNTYQFNNNLYVNYMRRVDWDWLDESVQDTIKFLAGKQLCSNDLEDEVKADAQSELFTAAIIQMKKTNLRVQRRNIFTTPRVLRAMHRVRPYRLQSAGGTNPTFPGG